jgi:hypothetical protein
VPFDDDTFVDPVLESAGFVYNKIHNLLICWECKSYINMNSAVKHAKVKHHLKHLPKDTQDRIASLVPNAVSSPTHPETSVKAIYGLCNPRPAYLITACCNRGYKNADSVKRHNCSVQGNQNPSKARTSHVQSFAIGHSFFPVHVPVAPDHTNLLPLAIFQKSLPKVDIHENKIVLPANYRELSIMLENERWIEHVTGRDPILLISLVAVPSESDLFSTLSHHVYELVNDLQDMITMYPYQLREAIAARPTQYVFIYCIVNYLTISVFVELAGKPRHFTIGVLKPAPLNDIPATPVALFILSFLQFDVKLVTT